MAGTNPYVVGSPIGQPLGFFGRADIFETIEDDLTATARHPIVLYGQRRIGKTSILRQLQRRLASQQFVPVYFDLMTRAYHPLDQVLFELAATIADSAQLQQPNSNDFNDQGRFFHRNFLPEIYMHLPPDYRLVLLLDEFDAFDANDSRAPLTAAAKTFFPYLRQLMEGEPRLSSIFVVGRRADSLTKDVEAIFKYASRHPVSVLQDLDARELARTAERQGTLTFAKPAVDRIMALTAGHPYFIQLICHTLWNDAHAGDPASVPTIDISAVEATAPKAVNAARNIFEWTWERLLPMERVVFAALADLSEEQSVVTKEQLQDVLKRHDNRILSRDLDPALDEMVKWELLRHTRNGYQFFVELMRRWFAQNKRLSEIKDELDRVVPLANTLFLGGDGYYQQGDVESAEQLLRMALEENPNHFKAKLLLGHVLGEQKRFAESITVLEGAYSQNEDGARETLLVALLAQGQDLQQSGIDDDALKIYERAIEIAPAEMDARDRFTAIWNKRGEDAEAANDLDAALAAYQEAGNQEKVALMKRTKEQRALERAAAEAQAHEEKEEWDAAIAIYQELAARQPREDLWQTALERCAEERNLSELYLRGQNALQQDDISEAKQILAELISMRPDYKNAAELLASAVRMGQARPSLATATPAMSDTLHLSVGADLTSPLVRGVGPESAVSAAGSVVVPPKSPAAIEQALTAEAPSLATLTPAPEPWQKQAQRRAGAWRRIIAVVLVIVIVAVAVAFVPGVLDMIMGWLSL